MRRSRTRMGLPGLILGVLVAMSSLAPAPSSAEGDAVTTRNLRRATPSQVRRELRTLGYAVPNLRAYLQAKAAADAAAGSEPAAAARRWSVRAPTTVGGPGWNGLYDENVPGPGDAVGAIGPTRYVELVNKAFAIYERSGVLIADGKLKALTHQASKYLGDPQIIWDSDTSRFYYAAHDSTWSSSVPAAGSNSLLFGWSTTASPSSASDWCSYSLDYGHDLPDYPKLGDTSDFLLIGINDFLASGTGAGDVRVIAKPGAGAACPTSPASWAFTGLLTEDGSTAYTPVPANQIDPSSTGYVVATEAISGSGTNSALTLYTVSKVAGVPSLTSVTPVTLPVTAYGIPASAEQPPGPHGSTLKIDTLDGRLTNAVSAYDPRLGKLAVWTQHTIFGGAGAEVRWYEIDPTVPTLLQTGDVAGDRFAFNGAISPDRAVVGATAMFGDTMILGFDTSSATKAVAVQMVAKAGDTPQSGPVLVHGSDGAYNCILAEGGATCRWGDYSSATPDPVAEPGAVAGRVWFTNEWNVVDPSSRISWRTWNWSARALARQPDATVKGPSDPSFLGDDIYNTTGEGQTARSRAWVGISRDFAVRVQNDGAATDSFTIGGCGSSTGFVVSYSVGGTDVTGAVVAGTYAMADVAPGSAKAFQVTIAVKHGAALGSTKTCTLTATSVGDAGRKDVVKAKVEVNAVPH